MKFNFISLVKKRLVNLPYSIGRVIAFLPFQYRPGIGQVYSKRLDDITNYQVLTSSEKEEFIFNRVKALVVYSYENIAFYKSFYQSKSFNPNELKQFADLTKIPIISKSDLIGAALYNRINPNVKSYMENTGGSSGKPLELMIQPSSVGHEWAHMHAVWDRVGFNPSDLRVVFSGRSRIKEVIQYDAARHQLNLDIYVGWPVVADKLQALFGKYSPSYLHGYPSAIFDFILWLQDERHPLLNILKSNIRGLMLGSEYPNPTLRAQVEEILGCDSVSWYGHTERCVLAYEKETKYEYLPFQTYGYTEAVEIEGQIKLVATSYYNYAHPLIRYNTEDGVQAINKENILTSFKISSGRDGEFILDKAGHKVSLTGLIFGRHHRLFEYCTSIQVFQKKPGYAEILYVPRVDLKINPSEHFDESNVDIEFSYSLIETPYKTKSGKKPLLVNKL